jgi:rfaE bifunctional protein kinase chain/domain
VNDRLLELLAQFPGKSVGVIGDLVADLFVYGEAARVSREAPVLIIEHESDRIALGGAANAANNVKALGGEPVLVGLVGDDLYGEMLLDALSRRGIKTDYVIKAPDRPTTTKQRIVASGLHTTYQQIVRVDRGSRAPVEGRLQQLVLDAIDLAAGESDLMVASDYGYGVFSEDVRDRVAAIAESEWCKVMVDSRFQLLQFKGAYLMTPNEPEAGEASRVHIRDDADVERAADRLLHGADAHAVAVTRGKKGMYVKERDRAGEFIPIYGPDEVADVTGAGDTVMAAFALAGACGADLSLAARAATVAAGLSVLKHGAAVVTPEEFRAALEKLPWRE